MTQTCILYTTVTCFLTFRGHSKTNKTFWTAGELVQCKKCISCAAFIATNHVSLTKWWMANNKQVSHAQANVSKMQQISCQTTYHLFTQNITHVKMWQIKNNAMCNNLLHLKAKEKWRTGYVIQVILSYPNLNVFKIWESLLAKPH